MKRPRGHPTTKATTKTSNDGRPPRGISQTTKVLDSGTVATGALSRRLKKRKISTKPPMRFRNVWTTDSETGSLLLLPPPASFPSSPTDQMLPERVPFWHFCRTLQRHFKQDEVAYANWQCPCPYGNPRVLHMNNIEVNKRMRRQGIGSLVVERVLQRAAVDFPQAGYLCGEFAFKSLPFWKANGLVKVTDQLRTQEPQLENYDWCIPLPRQSPKSKDE